MEIRGDFVTNSSSVSYILTIKEEVIDGNIESIGGGIHRYLSVIKNEIKENGEKITMGNEEIYYMEMDIDPQETIPLSEFTNKSTPATIDFKERDDDEILSLFKWIILEDKTQNLYGIGATIIRDI